MRTILLCILGLPLIGACSEWGLTGRNNRDGLCDGQPCDTDASDIECEVDSRPGEAILAPLDCLPETDRFAVRMEWEHELIGSGAGVSETVMTVTPDTDTTSWVATYHQADYGPSNHLLSTIGGQDGTARAPREPLDDPLLLRNRGFFTTTLEPGGPAFLVFAGLDSIQRFSPELGMERIASGVPMPKQRGLAFGYPGDFDQDGRPEVIVAGNAAALNGSILHAQQNPDIRTDLPMSGLADLDGDGTRELITSEWAVRADGSRWCTMDDELRDVTLADSDGDGRPEVFTTLPSFPDSTVSVWDEACAHTGDVDLRAAVGERADAPLTLVRLAVAPLLRPDRPAFVYTALMRDEGGRYVYHVLILDEDLDLVRLLAGPPDGVKNPIAAAADLDGDGVFELVVTGLEPDGRATLLDARSGESVPVGNGQAYQVAIADVDGDRHAEILLREASDTRGYVRAYGGAAGEWRPATRTWMGGHHLAWLQNPDGTATQEPTRWDRVGFTNASPSFAWWWGVGADLIVAFDEVCSDRCDEGRATATVRVGNQGVEDVGRPVRLAVYGVRGDSEELLYDVAYDEVPAGTWLADEVVQVSFDGAPYERLRAVVSGDGWTVEECDDTNNDAEVAVGCE